MALHLNSVDVDFDGIRAGATSFDYGMDSLESGHTMIASNPSINGYIVDYRAHVYGAAYAARHREDIEAFDAAMADMAGLSGLILDETEPEPEIEPAMVKRGPGRPKGSKNRPKN